MEVYAKSVAKSKSECLCADRLYPWHISGKYLVLDRKVSLYHIPLQDLTTRAGWLDWHRHLMSKTWAHADVFIGLEVAAHLVGGAA
jgi:hypothetical protein